MARAVIQSLTQNSRVTHKALARPTVSNGWHDSGTYDSERSSPVDEGLRINHQPLDNGFRTTKQHGDNAWKPSIRRMGSRYAAAKG